jgi:hypothetical protein
MKIYKLALTMSILGLSLGISACEEEESATSSGAGEMSAGEMAAGEMAAGEMAAGEMVAGEMVAGEMSAGEMVAGEMAADPNLEDLTQLAFEWLAGSFNSEEQSRRQPSYFAINLFGCEVDAPNVGAKALYIEQAVLDNLGAPYRQRLYIVEPVADSEDNPIVTSSVFEFVNEDELIGLCSIPREDRPSFAPADVAFKPGCEVYLEWRDDHFEGGTRGESCLSSLNDATYATSEVYIDANTIRSWDQGFDAQGVQVWGATEGPYEFLRQE